MSDLIPGAVYHANDLYRTVIVERVESIEVEGEFPVFVVVNDEERSEVGQMWTVTGTGLACDDDKGVKGLFEDRLLDDIEQKSGESWEAAIKRELPGIMEDDDDDSWRQEIAMEAGMLHGVDAYNDAMGYSVGDPDEDWDDWGEY